MISLFRGGGIFPSRSIALMLGAWLVSSSMFAAMGDDPQAPVQATWKVGNGLFGRGAANPANPGTPGHGPHGPHPGEVGFGLSFHRGQGYGGNALGIGPEGGYPFHGGPGYCQPWPTLRRLHGITPFPYFGGPGFPTPEHPHFFGGVGPLVPDEPVITIVGDGNTPDSSGDYGGFTGVLPYPESYFAPFSSPASPGGPAGGMDPASSPPTPANATPGIGSRNSKDTVLRASGEAGGRATRGNPLGIEDEAVIQAGGARGLKVSKVYPGTTADKAGLRAGDVIESINGYVTATNGDLAWIIADASRSKVLAMSVRPSGEGVARTLTARLP